MKNITFDFAGFVAFVKTLVTLKCPEITITIKNVTKANRELTGLAFKTPNKNIGPIIYLDSWYEDYIKGTYTIKEIVEQIYDTYIIADSNIPEETSISIEFAEVCNKICYKLVSEINNSSYLKSIPHRRVENTDLHVVYYIYIDENTSIPITNSLLSNFDKTEEDLYELASINTPLLLGTYLKGLCATMGFPIEKEVAYILSNEHMTLGASSILNYSTLERFAADFGNFYIIPSSIHEVLLVPEEGIPVNTSEMLNSVRSINAESVAPEDKLSDNIYYYSSDNQSITIITE